MHKCQLAYRHANGEVEGFAAVAFTPTAARRNAEELARSKCAAIGQAYDANRLLVNANGLSAAEMRQIKKDWKTG